MYLKHLEAFFIIIITNPSSSPLGSTSSSAAPVTIRLNLSVMVRPTDGQVSLNCHRDDQKDAEQIMMMAHDDHFDDDNAVKPCTEGDPVEWIVNVGEDVKQVRWVKLPWKHS